ncbi:MAG: ATPase, partial [Saprospiraceae bacterium]|nr:ATPase [Saprospiraceae bacterium]
MQQTFLCIASYFKGKEFIIACKEAGNRVILVTDKKLENKSWPWDHIDDVFYLEGNDGDWNVDHLIGGTAWLMRSTKIDRIVALDDFDVERAAAVREELRFPGMGQTTARHFRDKLAMRMKAAEAGIAVPPFSPLFNDEEINHYIETVSPPWVVKPRGEASATGIKKVHSGHELWEVIHSLGDDRFKYLVEQFKPGDVYHVDALSVDGKQKFCSVSQYLSPPFEVAHGGGIFRSHTVQIGGEDDKALQSLNEEVLKAFGMKFSASHTEYIKSHEDGKFYFLETSSRVGGAHLSDMVDKGTGVNLWAEWAKLETAMAKGEKYTAPKKKNLYAGIIVSLARQQWPDMSCFDDPEVVWKIDKEYHVGIIVQAKTRERVLELL